MAQYCFLEPQEHRCERQPAIAQEPTMADAGNGVQEHGHPQSQKNHCQVAHRGGPEAVEQNIANQTHERG